MNLLLLLSALLSALTGVSAGGRAGEPRAVTERMVASPVATRVAAATRRPANVAAGLVPSAWTRAILPPEPPAIAPLYRLRPRE